MVNTTYAPATLVYTNVKLCMLSTEELNIINFSDTKK